MQECFVLFSHFFSRHQVPYWFAGFALILVLSSCHSTSTFNSQPVKTPTPLPLPGTPFVDLRGVRQFTDTWNNIHLFQSFDYNISDPANVASHYDFVWGAKVNHVQAIRASNPGIFITYYIPFHREHGTFSDQSAIHDLNYWKAVHPDWVLYKCDRVTPAYEFGNPNIPLDFSNLALVPWQIQTYALPASESGYDGIAADNVDLQNYYGACGVYVNGKWKQRYTGQYDDPQWRADIIGWLSRMQQALHHLHHPLALIPNLAIGDLPPDNATVRLLLNHIDGVLDEGGFTDYARGYLTDNKWLQRIQFMESVQQQHKPYYVVNQFNSPSIDSREIQWTLASYLIGKEHLAAIFISTFQGYGSDTRYFEYDAQIGSPVGGMYQSQNVYWRNYSGGLSIVNPSATKTYIITLNAGNSYVDLHGYAIKQRVTLPPHSGIVLLTNS